LGLGYALGWGGYGWGWPYYYYTSPSYYAYDYPTYYAYPSTTYYDSAPRASAYYDTLASNPGASLTTSPYRAKVEILVPDSNAQLIVEGQSMSALGSRRFFVSPELDPSKTYSYIMTMRSNVSGRPEEDTRQIDVRAGSLVRVDFTQPVIHDLPAPGRRGNIFENRTPPPAVPPK
jgi:uncharacterized protein (TIGR03000 family)